MSSRKTRLVAPGSQENEFICQAASLIDAYAAHCDVPDATAVTYITAAIAMRIGFRSRSEIELATNLDAACEMLRRNATHVFLLREDV